MRALLRIAPVVGSIAATISIFVGCGADEQESVAVPPNQAAAVDVTYVGSAECARCHPRSSADWTGSHHDLAMQIATNETVLGDFADREFDLVVVGAGVYGAATAWDASLRGLSVALIDKGDFGSGTSFNNLKTIHGGLRYLQHADFIRMRESVRERRNLMRIAPHLVHPLPFLVPTYRGSFLKSRTAMRAALFVNDLVSWDRNDLADRQKHLPAGKALTRDACLEMAPGIERDQNRTPSSMRPVCSSTTRPPSLITLR